MATKTKTKVSETPTKTVTVVKPFTFWPLMFIAAACALLLVLTILSRNKIRVNTFLAMMATGGLFGLTMVGFSLELAKRLTWRVIWKPFTVAVAVVIVLVFVGWLLERNSPDLVAE